jgi:hypothetical protein
VTALYFGADFQLTRDLKAASDSARWIYNALDALVSNRSGKQAGTSDEFRQLRGDPGLQRELRKENTDLTMLETAQELTPELLDALQSVLNGTAKSPAGQTCCPVHRKINSISRISFSKGSSDGKATLTFRPTTSRRE